MNHARRIRVAAAVGWCALTVTFLLSSGLPTARACSTPVFRYAMYRWPAAPYYVFYLHGGEPAKEDEAINKAVEEAYDAKTPINIVLETVDASKQEQFDRMPKEVRDVWESKAEDVGALHAVFSPWGIKQFTGRLDAERLKAMVDSPVRQQIGKLFDEGNAMVMLILTGPKEEANRKAEKVVDEAVAMAAGGEIPTADDYFAPEQFLPPPAEGEAAEGSEDAAAEGEATATDEEKEKEDAEPKLKVAKLKLARADAKEQWLVRMLLAVEADLNEFPDEAMVFVVYGRARAMPPYIGKGITKENLADCMAFLAGACSCTVKDQNPGMDLLMQWDWDATAEKMAEDDPQFASDPWEYQEFEPETEEPADGNSESESPAEDNSTSDAVAMAEPEAGTVDPAPTEDPPTEDGEQAAHRDRAVEGADDVAQQRPDPAPPSDEALGDEAGGQPAPGVTAPLPQSQPPRARGGASFATRGLLMFGVVLGAGIVIVLVAGVLMVGRRGPS